jgi:hypothetical protein
MGKAWAGDLEQRRSATKPFRYWRKSLSDQGVRNWMNSEAVIVAPGCVVWRVD